MNDAMLIFSSAYIAATCLTTGIAHVARPGRLRRDLVEHHLVPGAAQRPVAAAVPLCEIAIGALALLGLIAPSGAAGLVVTPLAAAGLAAAFLWYVRNLLLGRSSRGRAAARTAGGGRCGCSPLETALTRLSLVPAAALLIVGALGSVAALAGGEAAIGREAGSWLFAGWGVTDAALVLLLPASVGPA